MKTGGRADGNGGLVAGLGGARTGEQITPILGGCGRGRPSRLSCFQSCKFFCQVHVVPKGHVFRHSLVVFGVSSTPGEDTARDVHKPRLGCGLYDGQFLWLRISQGALWALHDGRLWPGIFEGGRM